MIHTIKSLYDNGNGSSIRAIAKQLNISRNTVRKYLRLDESTISEQQDNRARHKRLDDCRGFITHLLQTYPKLSAVKIQRKLQNKYPALNASDRTIRRYVQSLRSTVANKRSRYYEPILDMVPGEQCQVNPGELRGVLIGGVERIANVRTHATTGESPRARFEQYERQHLVPYLAPTGHLTGQQRVTRKADKTGLISWQPNKYSVPMVYQQTTVEVEVMDEILHLYDANDGSHIATHSVFAGRGKVFENSNHYRDLA